MSNLTRFTINLPPQETADLETIKATVSGHQRENDGAAMRWPHWHYDAKRGWYLCRNAHHGGKR